MFTSTKAQVWGYDLIIAITIFLIGLIGVYIYATNFADERDNLQSLFYQGRTASSLILSEGSPASWNPEYYEVPGILTLGKINQTKLDSFYSLDYDSVRKKLGLNYEFYFYLPNLKILDSPIDGLGKKPESPKNLVKVERFVLYENKLTKFVILIWN